MEDKTKASNISKTNERRQPESQIDFQTKKKQGLPKNDFSSMASSQTLTYTPASGKVLNEVENIIKIGIEKEVALSEKDTIIKNSNDIIDNLRKNILHLQMEYEKLDQSYQREVSYRSEIIKRMDTTRGIVETAVQYSGILSASIKQLENDKLKIAEFYELIYQGQKEVEAKHSELEKIIKNQDDSLKDKIENLKLRQEKFLSENSAKQDELHKCLSLANDKLKTTCEENEKLLSQILEFKQIIKNLETSLEDQKNVHCEQTGNINKLKFLLQNLRNKKIKSQRSLKNKFMEVEKLKKQNKILIKNMKKLKIATSEFYSKNKTLEIEKNEMKSTLENLLESDSNNQRFWEAERKDFFDKISARNNDISKLNLEKSELSEKLLDISNKKSKIEVQFDELQNNFSVIFNDNKLLTENINNLNQDIDNKSKTISELEVKLNNLQNLENLDITYLKNESKKYKEMIKDLKGELCHYQNKLTSQIEQKQQLINEFESGLEENLKSIKTKMKQIEDLVIIKTNEINKLQDKIEDKNSCVLNLKCQVKNLRQIAANNEVAKEKLSKNLEELNLKNIELSKSLENLTEHNQFLNKELKLFKSQISELEQKLTLEKMTSKSMESHISHLKKEIEREKKSFDQLQEKYLKAENSQTELNNVLEENSMLKSSVVEMKKSLEEVEAKAEAYKVIVKKLESETNFKEMEEISKLKLDLVRLEEVRKRDESFFKLQMETLQQNFSSQLNKKEQEIIDLKKTMEKHKEFENPSYLEKENKTNNNTEVDKFHDPLTPLQNNKKFLLTPRKILNSTPQVSESSNIRLQSDPHVNKKRDPYEFDSDSSVERFDADQVLKVFNSCKKKNITKKPKKNN